QKDEHQRPYKERMQPTRPRSDSHARLSGRRGDVHSAMCSFTVLSIEYHQNRWAGREAWGRPAARPTFDPRTLIALLSILGSSYLPTPEAAPDETDLCRGVIGRMNMKCGHCGF